MQDTEHRFTSQRDGEAANQATEAADSANAADASVTTDTENDLQQALTRADQNYEQFLRAKAEGENIRRRAQEDVAKAYKFAIESFAESLVPVIDSLEKALQAQDASPEAMREGVELTLKQLQSAFAKNNLKEVDPLGQKFDPHLHEAIAVVPAPDGVAPNHVVSVLQKGWTISDRVLRPALVTVAQG